VSNDDRGALRATPLRNRIDPDRYRQNSIAACLFLTLRLRNAESAALMATLPPDLPQPFGKYTLLKKLAQGGMAEIFLARATDSARLCVIKRILPAMAKDTQFLSMFLTEARVAAQLDHPNIIQIFDLGREGSHFFLAMEYIDGTDLEHLAKLCGDKLPPDMMARIGADLCDALHFANRSIDMATGKPLNVIHRDVTPGNVMITRQGVVKLVDFGVAKATAQIDRTKTGVVKGKFRYMSPEQLQLQELDGRSDLFSVGVLLYELSTGTKPFDRPQVIEVIRALTAWDPPPPHKAIPGYPKAISEAIAHALIKDRNKRYRDGTEMKLALEKALATLPDVTDVPAFIARYLPPPIAVPSAVPQMVAPPPLPMAALEPPAPPILARRSPPRELKASKVPNKEKERSPTIRPLPSFEEDGPEEARSTKMGLPVFDAKGRVIDPRLATTPAPASAPPIPPAALKPSSPLRRRSPLTSPLASIEEEDASPGEAPTKMGLPLFDAVGRVIGHETRAAPSAPSRQLKGTSAKKRPLPELVDARSAKAVSAVPPAGIDQWTWDDGVSSEEGTVTGVDRPKALPPTAPKNLLAALGDDAPLNSDGENTVRDRRGKRQASDAGTSAGRASLLGAMEPLPRPGQPHPHVKTAAALPSRAQNPRRPISLPSYSDDADLVDDDADMDAASEVVRRVTQPTGAPSFPEHPGAPSPRRLSLPLIIALAALILLGAMGGGVIYVTLQKPAAGPSVPTAKGRIVIDGQGTVSFDGRACRLPCVRDVEANTPYRVAHGSDPTRVREISVAPDETRRLTIDEL
jgi:serine/threonine protein kinase